MIGDGYGKIQEGTFKFIHRIDLNSYDDFLQKTKEYIETYIPETNPLQPTLKYELFQTIDLLETLKNYAPKRKSRSINTLGKIWKIIAGSPDHDDAEYIYKTLDELTDNNNKQVIINTDFSNQLNNITKLINTFSNSIRKDNFILNENIEILSNKIRLAKEGIINVKHAIQWAKYNIINSYLLNKKEMNFVINQLKKENMPFNNIEEALELSNINVLSNNTNILYIIKIPITSEILYKKLIVKPIIKNNTIINLNFTEIFLNENETYAIKENCKIYNKIKICKKIHLLDLSKDNCITNIIFNKQSSCTKSNVHHIPRVEEIADGIILLNDVNTTISTETITYKLNGTFIIKFDNTTIKIDDKIYQNLEANQMKPIPALMQETPIEEKNLSILSLESLQELHLNNIKAIHNIKREAWVRNIVISLTLLGTVSLTIWTLKRSQKKPITTFILQPTKSLHVEKNQVETPVTRINEIPYF